MKKSFYAVLIICSLFFISCDNKKEEVIVFDETYPLALAPDVSWAVITDPYVAYKENPDWTSGSKGHCRKGEILQVMGKSTDKNNEIWYSFEDGWLPYSSLSIYSNRLKAQTASDNLKD